MDSQNSSPFSAIRRTAPTFVVLGLMCVLAFYGHRTGWAFPKLSELRPGSAAKEDWCPAHNVPDSRCIACHPELGGADPKDWCKEHGVPESQCTTCHPEILTKGKAADWCKEHGVPESQCTLCHPDVAVRGQAPAPVVSATVSADPKPETPGSVNCKTHATRVQFASREAVAKAGIELASVQERPITASIEATGELDYDQTRIARVGVRVPGSVWRVEHQLGDEVKRGEILAFLDAAEVGRAKAELLQGLAEVDLRVKTEKRVSDAGTEGLRTKAEVLEAKAALRGARIKLFNAQQALGNLGVPCALDGVEGLDEREHVERVRVLGYPPSLDPNTVTTANLLAVVSPIDGTIVSRDALAGEVVDPSHTLFVVADTRRIAAVIDVRLEDAGGLRRGETLLFIPDGSADDAASGKLTWISTAVDEKTRTIRARAELENPDGRLRAHVFGRVRISKRESPNAIAVPNEAVQWEGCCHVVFVRLTDEVFQTRKVRLGSKNGAFTEIEVGVLPGEVVVTTGSHVLKSEILKSKLGAGCCAND